MKDLLLYIARSLVEHPEQVSVTEVEEGDELTLQLRVAPEDMGKVIGRQGRIAKEIRTVVRSYARRRALRLWWDIVDCRRGPSAAGGGSFFPPQAGDPFCRFSFGWRWCIIPYCIRRRNT